MHSEAIQVIKSKYGDQATKLLNLCDEAVIVLARSCQEGSKINLSDASIDRLAAMEPSRQCGYLVNPWMEFFMDRALGALTSGTSSNTSVTSMTKNSTNNNKSVEPAPVIEKEKEKPAPVDDDVAPIFDIFN